MIRHSNSCVSSLPCLSFWYFFQKILAMCRPGLGPPTPNRYDNAQRARLASSGARQSKRRGVVNLLSSTMRYYSVSLSLSPYLDLLLSRTRTQVEFPKVPSLCWSFAQFASTTSHGANQSVRIYTFNYKPVITLPF